MRGRRQEKKEKKGEGSYSGERRIEMLEKAVDESEVEIREPTEADNVSQSIITNKKALGERRLPPSS